MRALASSIALTLAFDGHRVEALVDRDGTTSEVTFSGKEHVTLARVR